MSSKKQRLLIGAHISVAGSFEKSIARAESIGCTTMQIFTKSNRQWNAKSISQEEGSAFVKVHTESSLKPIIAHATYLINLGAPNTEIHNKSINALIMELERCDQLGIHYLVLHPGSAGADGDIEACIEQIAQSLNLVFSRYSGPSILLLENMAGQGSAACYSFEQLATILKKADHKTRLGVCFDTCHAFAAGYDMRTPEVYNQMWKDFDENIGLDRLKVIHLNDSKKELGSRVDRHADIGMGAIGNEGFRLIMNDPRFYDIPKIIETPKGDNELADDERNLNALKKLLSPETKHTLGV